MSTARKGLVFYTGFGAALLAASVALGRAPVRTPTETAYRRALAVLGGAEGERALAVPLRFATALEGDSLAMILVWGDLPGADAAHAAGAVDSLTLGFLHATTATNLTVAYDGYTGTWTVRTALPPALTTGILGASWPYTVCLAVRRTWPAQGGRVTRGAAVCAPMRWIERRMGDPVLRYYDEPAMRAQMDSLLTRTPL